VSTNVQDNPESQFSFPASQKIPPTLAHSVDSLTWVLKAIGREPGYGPKEFNGIGLGNDNTYYFDPEKHPESDTIKALVSTELIAFFEIFQDCSLVYIPCGISSGLRAHEAALIRAKETHAKQAPSTYKIDEFLGSERHYNEVIAPNIQDNLRRSAYVQKLLPHGCIVPPVMREMSVRELVRNSALSGRLKYEEEAFMALWYPLIDHCSHMVLDGDWNYSRNSIWEMTRGVLVQSGLVPFRPKADMEVITINGEPISLLTRTMKLADSLKYSLGKGFEPREAATALAQIFTIDSWLRERDPRVMRAHKILRHRTKSELAAMDKVRAEIDPLILTYCAGWLRTEDLLLPYIAAQALGSEHSSNKAEPHPPLDRKLASQLKKFADAVSVDKERIIRGDITRETQAQLDRTQTPQQRRFDPEKSIFGPLWRSTIAEDNLFEKLPFWEQTILPFVFGAMEIALFPLQHPAATVLYTDLKRGRLAFSLAQKKRINNIAELPAALGRDTLAEVITPNLAAIEAQKKALKKKNPGRIITATTNFLGITDTLERLRQNFTGFVAATGANETSPRMRLVLAMKFLERNVEVAIFQEGWEHSDDLVQLRVRARLIQAKQLPRAIEGPVNLKVYTGKNITFQNTLLDDLALLTEKIEYCAAHGVSMSEQALALLRTLELHDLLVDPQLRRNAIDINPHHGEVTWRDYDHQKFYDFRARAEKVLFQYPELWPLGPERLISKSVEHDTPERRSAIPVENLLMQNILQAIRSGEGQQQLRKAQRPTLETWQVFDGPQS